MGARHARRSFGAGSYAQRHQQGYQALTGAIVMGLAVATLTLHHFGFGLAILCAGSAAVVCVVARVQPVASVYVVGAALLAGILVAPPHAMEQRSQPQALPAGYSLPQDAEYEMYVLKDPVLPGSNGSLPQLEFETEEWRNPADEPTGPLIFEL